jgi:pilus assembly protein CpaF
MAAHPSDVYEQVRTRLKRHLAGVLEVMPDQQAPSALRAALEDSLRQVMKALPAEDQAFQLPRDEQDRLIEETVNEAVGYGVLDRLIADPTISEIMVNGPREIFIERDGRLQRVDATFRDAAHLMSVIERMLGSANLTVNEANPICDASLPDGSRINVIIPPLVLNGPAVTIRRKLREWTMRDYVANGTLSEQAAEFLEGCVKAKVNFVISGGSSTGKTTLVSILASAIPPDHRIITIEGVAEFELPGRQHWVRLIAKPPNVENRGEIPLRVLVKNALRMRPDRIILGEARGGEALDVVQAMHTGHDGFITVLHANSPHAALDRLETLMLMSGVDVPPAVCRVQIATAVDLVVHVGRFVDGSRRVATVSQVHGVSQEGFVMEDLFVFEVESFAPDGKLSGRCRYTGAKPKVLAKFHLHNVAVPPWMAA